jgi:Peptidase family M48
VQHLDSGSGAGLLMGKVFGWYGRLYLRVSRSVTRHLELEADVYSAQLAGRSAAITALVETRVLATAWEFFLDGFALAGASQGQCPAPLLAGFHQLLTAPGRQEELAALRADAAEGPASPYDTHPTLAERIAALQRLPDDERIHDGRIDDHRLAVYLLEQPDAILAEVEQWMFADRQLRPVSWEQLAAGVAAVQVRGSASLLTKAAESGRPLQTATLGTVVQLMREGGPANWWRRSPTNPARRSCAPSPPD